MEFYTVSRNTYTLNMGYPQETPCAYLKSSSHKGIFIKYCNVVYLL